MTCGEGRPAALSGDTLRLVPVQQNTTANLLSL